MRLIFFGTSKFAVPILEALLQRYEVAAVVTRPDEPVGRKQILTPSPVKAFLTEKKINIGEVEPPREVRPLSLQDISQRETKIEILQPEKLSPLLPRLKELQPDLIIVAAYGKIIPEAIIDLPPLGCLNVHPSLLPRFRGPSPIQYTILNGDKETGVTIIKIDKEADHGPIVGRSNLPGRFDLQKLNSQELMSVFAEQRAQLLTDTLPKYINGEITPQEQDHAKATFTKLLAKEDGHIDWNKPAEYIERMIRAYDPWPGTWTKLRIADCRLQILKILRVREYGIDTNNPSPLRGEGRVRGDPGTVFLTSDGDLAVAANPGAIILEQVQPEGKRPMSGKEFLNGHRDIVERILP